MDAAQPEEPAKKEPFDTAALIVPGTFAERVDLQLGLLTQGVADCMILATGAFPGLTEGVTAQPAASHYSHRPPPPAPNGNAWQAARSAELRDAARLSEASARLLLGFARLRGTFRQDFTVRHTQESPAAKDGGRGTTVVTQRFAVPGAGEEQPVELGAEIAGQLGKSIEAMAKRRDAGLADDKNDPRMAEARHDFAKLLLAARAREAKKRQEAEEKARAEATKTGDAHDPPPPPAQS